MLIRLFLAMGLMVLMDPATLGWFAASSTVAGFGVAVWLSRRGGVQQLFVKAEEPREAQAGSEMRIPVLHQTTVTAALVLGILLGYLFANLISLQLHAEAFARAAVLT